MIPTLNSVTSVRLSQDSAYNDMERRDDEGSEDLSNAELYLKRSKKRGLYVETGASDTTTTPTDTNVTQHLQQRILPSKPQPRRFLPRDLSPLPGRSDNKPFTWSVLDDSSPATSESDIVEANKKIQSTIQEIKNVINDITFGSNTKTNTSEDARKKIIEEASEAIIIGNRNRESRESNASTGRTTCTNVKNMLEVRKKELTLTLRTVVKDPPNNRFCYRFVHEEEKTSVDSHHVKIRKRATSSLSYNSEASKRTSSNKLPDPIQINYEDEIKSSDNKRRSTYPYDLNSNRESTFYFHGSESYSKTLEDVDKSHFLSSSISEAKASYDNLVVIQPKKECDITSQSQISENEELEVLDIDLNATTNSSRSCTKTLMGNNFYTNNNDRSDILRKHDTNANTSDDNEVFGFYSSYNHADTVKSISSEEIPILYDSVDATNNKERGYELATYLLDEQNDSDNNDIVDDRYTVADEYDSRTQRRRRVHTSPKTVTPVTTNYPRRNKRQRRIVKSFASAEKRRKYLEKEKLLNLIKQQLSLDYINMEPPRSVFEELKEMAKNKRRRYKRVNFSNDMENYERRLRRTQERRAQKNERDVKRFMKNPHSIIKRNTETYKDLEFFDKFKAMNKKVGNRKTMTSMYVNQRIQEIHDELSDTEDEDDVEVFEGESLQVINM